MGAYLTSLADAGHSVVLLDTIFEQPAFDHPNISRIRLHLPQSPPPSRMVWESFSSCFTVLSSYVRSDLVFNQMQDKYEQELKALITDEWDLLIVDALFANHGYALATLLNRRFGTPYVMVETAAQLFDWQATMKGLGWNPVAKNYQFALPSAIPHKPYDPTSFGDRLVMAVSTWIEVFAYHYYPPTIDYPAIRRFGVEDFRWPAFLNGAALMFADRIERLGWVRPGGSDLIDIGAKCSKGIGRAAEGAAELPEDLRSFVGDPQSEGTIFIAFGSYANWTAAPAHLLDAFRFVLPRLFAFRVVFSFNGPHELLPALPHVRLTNWAPQAAILRHPRTRLFISHVGLKSLKESICAGVPVLAVPLRADQAYAGDLVVKTGIGRVLHKQRVDGPQLWEQMQEMLTNERYVQTVRRLSALFVDQPIAPSALALHKTERLLRVGPKRVAFRRHGAELTWLEFLYGDLAVLLLVLVLVVARK
ncbi:UDP-glucuronosyltransferase [Aphelenchoides fujianensis]|nr:UDP-glucuronosyltransferase [Aphelenchoides fujianensis]